MILSMLERYLMSTDEEHERTSHWASDANACVRQLIYKWRKVPMSNPPTPGDVLKWRMGDAAEDLVGKAIDHARDKGEIVDYDAQVKRRIEIPGLKYPVVVKLDYVVYPHGDQQGEGVEVKSMFGRGIVNIQKTGKPKEDHMVQVYFYLYWTDRERHRLVYIGRDFGYRTEFLVTRVPGEGIFVNGQEYPLPAMSTFVEKFVRIEHYLETGEEPPRDFLAAIKNGQVVEKFSHHRVEYKSDWQCRYCPWQTRCWAPVAATMGSLDNNAAAFIERSKRETPPEEGETE